MPREAARIFLLVTDVRVERLQDISEDDAVAEGAIGHEYQDEDGNPMGVVYPSEEFSEIWDSTIKPADREKYGWAANPLVWAIAFERTEKPKGRS